MSVPQVSNQAAGRRPWLCPASGLGLQHGPHGGSLGAAEVGPEPASLFSWGRDISGHGHGHKDHEGNEKLWYEIKAEAIEDAIKIAKKKGTYKN